GPSQDNDSDTPPQKALTPPRRDHDPLQRLKRIPQSQERIPFLQGEIAGLLEKQRPQLTKLRKDEPPFDPDEPVPVVNLQQLRALLPKDVPTAMVQFTLTADKGLAIIITEDKLHAVDLPGFSLPVAAKLLSQWYSAYYKHKTDWDDALPQ